MATIGTFTLKFNTDVSMAGTLRAAVSVDKAAVEQIKRDVETIAQGVGNSQSDINQKHSDIVQKHGEVEADRQEVASNKITIDGIQANINSQQADITATQQDITTKGETVNTQAAQVASNVQAVANDKAHVTQTVNNFNTTAANATQAVTDEGNKQNTRVITQGDTQEDRVIGAGNTETASVTTEGQTQRNLIGNASSNEQTAIRNAGTIQVDRVQAEGNTQEARVTAEGNTQTARAAEEADKAASEASAAKSHKNSTQAIADKFGDVNGAITEATAQADRSKSEADRSTAQANISTSGGNKAKTEADRAKAEADRATAVVTGGDAVQTPTAGKIPLADSKGHLDINWTPLLAVMYPYSGVIGSVDKNSIFLTSASTQYSNAFGLNHSQWNIAGKFVDFSWKKINLPEAESTAARAIAFDDIFLDWNGTITTYRSITPHRTTTGYDRDAIATEHGYSKVQTGLYQSGETYALLLGRVARRNQGGYHPVFNLEGACAFTTSSNQGRLWYESGLTAPNNKTECFRFEIGFVHNSGKIGGSGWQLARPDSKPYDAIYANDFTPLYYSAKNVVDLQALLFDSFNRAVAGETFHASEGTVSGSILTLNDDYRSRFTGTEYITVSESSITFEAISQYQACTFNAGKGYTNFSLLKPTTFYFSSSVSRLTKGIPTWRIDYTDKDGKKQFPETGRMTSTGSFSGSITIPAGGTITRFYIQDIAPTTTGCDAIIENCIVYSDMPHLTDSARSQFLMVDIFGAQEAWPEEWKTDGLPGNWVAVGEEGESLIPDGTHKHYKLSRKCLECYQVLYTRDRGLTWTDQTSAWKSDFEGSTNSRHTDTASDTARMVFYRTSANPFELSPRSTMINIADGYASNYAASQSGPVLCSNLINKIPTATGYGAGFHFHYRLTKTTIDESRNLLQSSHAPLEIANAMPGFKALGYLSVETSRLFLNACYKEVRVKNNTLGDDGLLKTHNNQTTETDLNGETVIVGTKRVELPYQFDGVTY